MADEPDLNIGEAMSKKVGPLPTGVWLLAVGGGIAVAVFVRRRAASSAEDPGTGISTDTQPGAGNLGQDDTGGDTPAPSGRPTTNEDWFQQAYDAILGTHAGYSPSLVTTALTKYLEGQTLTTAEQAIVSMALRLVGPPPVPPPLPEPGNPPPPSSTPPPPGPSYPGPTKPPPKPPAPKPKPSAPYQYRVKHNDTLSAIAARYHMSWEEVWAYNLKPGVRPAATQRVLKARGPHKLYAGQLILIPRK